MPDFAYRTEATIDAAPKVLFDIVSDLSLHVELAGSGELKTVTQKPAGDVETGTRFLAEESVKLADGSGMDVTADSVVVICDTPTTFSWIVNPVLPDRLRRVQWWFHFTPEGDRTRVVHEVEIDFGDLQDEMLKGLRDNFEQVRAPVIRAGMDRTLENLSEDGCAVGILPSGRSCRGPERGRGAGGIDGSVASFGSVGTGRTLPAAALD